MGKWKWKWKWEICKQWWNWNWNECSMFDCQNVRVYVWSSASDRQCCIALQCCCCCVCLYSSSFPFLLLLFFYVKFYLILHSLMFPSFHFDFFILYSFWPWCGPSLLVPFPSPPIFSSYLPATSLNFHLSFILSDSIWVNLITIPFCF